MYTSWQVAAAIIARISGKEIHLTREELEAVKDTVPVAEYHPGKIIYRIGVPEAWPESEQRIAKCLGVSQSIICEYLKKAVK